MMPRKWLRRGAAIFQNALNSLLLPVFNILISALVVRLASPELWGEFVSVMVVVQFGAHLVSWGNKEYLLREFSLHPDRIASAWQTSLTTRSMLLLLLCGFLLLSGYGIYAVLWAVALVLAQSFEVITLYRRAFLFTFIVELTAISASVLFILINGAGLTADSLLMLFAVTTTFKALIYALRFRELWRSFHRTPDFSYFGAALPFFLLGFSGLLASRIDLYSVSYYLPQREVGEYQIFINLMLYIQSLSVMIVGPYAKNVYRLNDNAIFRISARLFILGFLLTAAGLAAAYATLTLVYHLQFSLLYLLLGGAFVLPIFAYLPLIYRLYKHNQTGLVLKANLIGAGVNLALNMVLLPRVGSIGAVAASAAVQWGMLVVYLWDYRHAQRQLAPAY